MPTEIKNYIQEKLTGLQGQMVSFNYDNEAILKNSADACILNIYGPANCSVVISDGITVISKSLSSDGILSVSIPNAAIWEITLSNGINTSVTNINIGSFGIYTVQLSFYKSYINVSYSPQGAVCTCSNGIVTLTDSSGDGTSSFEVSDLGTWEVSATLNGATSTRLVDVSSFNQTISVSLNIPPVVSTNLNDNEWSDIRHIIRAGLASSYWSIGDSKDIILNGTVGIKTFSNTQAKAYIIGIDHNTAVESSSHSSVHFGIGTTLTTAFVDSKYGQYSQVTPLQGALNGFNNYISFNRDNQIDWSRSYIKNNILPQMMSALPNELQDVISTVVKYSCRGTSVLVSSTNTLFIPSTAEILPSTSYLATNQVRYAFFSSSDPDYTIRKKDTQTSSSCAWLTRNCGKYTDRKSVV